MTRELRKGKEWRHNSYKYRVKLEVSTIPSFYIDWADLGCLVTLETYTSHLPLLTARLLGIL